MAIHACKKVNLLKHPWREPLIRSTNLPIIFSKTMACHICEKLKLLKHPCREPLGRSGILLIFCGKLEQPMLARKRGIYEVNNRARGIKLRFIASLVKKYVVLGMSMYR